MEWMLMPLRRYADFNGRSRRMEYWMFFLFYVLVFTICFILIFAGFPWAEMTNVDQPRTVAPSGPGSGPGALTYLGFGLITIFWLVTIIPLIAVTVRRFHDQDMSGWMYLLNFVPGIGGLIIMVFMFLPGTRGPNQYGDDPKHANSADAFL